MYSPERLDTRTLQLNIMIDRSMRRGKASLVPRSDWVQVWKNKGCRDDQGSYALGVGLDRFG